MFNTDLVLTARTSSSAPTTSFQPGAPGLGDSLYPNFGNGGYDAQSYDLTLNVTDVATSTLEGLAKIQARATQNLSSFNLDFIGFNIDNITVNGQQAQFSRSGQELTITPKKPITAGEEFTVRVKYNGSPTQITSVAIPVLTGWVIFDGGSFVLSEPDGAANYYPVNDHPLDKATYTFRVTVPNSYQAVANGVLKNKINNGDTTTYIYKARDPMASYLTTVDITNKFNLVTDKAPNGIPIRNYFADGISPDLLKPFELQGKMLGFFSELFGTYPFEVYGSVVMNTETGSALETQTLSIFGLDQLGRPDTDQIVAHELAHQWFGDNVSVGDWSDIWLNESFATYSQGLWIEYTQGHAAFKQWIQDEYDYVSKNLAKLVPPGEPKADDLFNPGVYDWGAVSLEALRLEIGDDAFFDTLRTYYDRFKGGNARTSDLINVAEAVSKKDLNGFFDQWVYSPTLPDLPQPQTGVDQLVGQAGVNLAELSGAFQVSVRIKEKTPAYSNKGGFYAVDNPYGVVIDPLTGTRIAPGEKGYAEAALKQSVTSLDTGRTTFTLQGGSYYIPYLITGSKSDQFYTPFTAANPDQLDHVQKAGAKVFKFEDQLGLGDRDFNDFSVRVISIAPIAANLT
jgi:aminopeptidase N